MSCPYDDDISPGRLWAQIIMSMLTCSGTRKGSLYPGYFPELWKRWDRHFIPDPPPKEFYPWILNHAQLHPSRGFHDGWSDLPRMRLHQHAAPRHGTRPLNNAEQHLEPEPPPVAPQPRRSARVAAQRAAHQPVLSPPGRPPDRWARGDFGSSSPIL